MRNALFEGLVFDEKNDPLKSGHVGEEAVYILDDDGFKKHVPAEKIDRAILAEIAAMIKGQEGMLTDQAASMMGTEDVFSKAIIENQLKNFESQFPQLAETGIPEEVRAYMGMTGFKVIVNYRGEIADFRVAGQSPGGE